MYYSFITRPLLWPNATLEQARCEVAEQLRSKRIKAETRQVLTELAVAIEQTLHRRGVWVRDLF